MSLRLPLVENLFRRAAQTWPSSVFGIFMSLKPATSHNDPNELRLASPTTTDEFDELSSTDEDWMYPPSPDPLPELELPVQQFADLRMTTTTPPEAQEPTTGANDDEGPAPRVSKASEGCPNPFAGAGNPLGHEYTLANPSPLRTNLATSRTHAR